MGMFAPGRQVEVRALRVRVGDGLAYWTVIDASLERVGPADAYLQHVRFGRGLAEGTTKSYAIDLALFLGWCESTGRDLEAAAGDLALFVAVLRTTMVARRGSGQDRSRSPARINHVLTVVREFYKHAVAARYVASTVLSFLFEVGDDRHLPAELKGEGAGLRYRAAPRHRLRQPKPAPPRALRQAEVEALISRPTTASRVSLSRKARTSASAKLTGIRPSIPDIRLLAEIRPQLSDPTHAVAYAA